MGIYNNISSLSKGLRALNSGKKSALEDRRK